MNTELVAFIRRYALFPARALVLCAVSGGADSVSLLHALCALREPLGIRLAAAHYNHGIRPTADRDEQFVRALCARLGVDCCVGRGDVPAAAAAAGEGLEQAARRLRYAFLEQTADRLGAAVIATAHTADDNLETMLFNLSRGSGAAGLAGIPPKRGRIVRPLLAVTRAQVEAYLLGHGLDHVEDETNASDDYARNRIRHRAVPVLKSVNPRAAEHALAAAERLRADHALLETLAADLTATARPTPFGLSIEAAALAGAPEPLAARCVLALARAQGAAEPNAAQIDAVLALARGSDVSAECALGGGVLAWRCYEQLLIGPDREPGFAPRPLARDGVTCVPELDLTVRCGPPGTNEKIHNSFLFSPIACGTIRGTLILRPRQTGDTLQLRGRPEKSLKKLFIEQKIPRRQRQAVPVLADDAGVVAVVGLGVDARRQAPDGPQLQIQVQYGGAADER